jgi:hypothetical protein
MGLSLPPFGKGNATGAPSEREIAVIITAANSARPTATNTHRRARLPAAGNAEPS